MKFRVAALLAIAIVLSAASPGPIFAAGANQVFLFASPTTQESLTDEDARARLSSFEQSNTTAVADRAACSLTHSVEIADTLGIYEKSSENSYILESDLARNESEYLAALLGLYSRQEFILLFFRKASGADRLWIIKTREPTGMAIASLRKLQLTPVTVRLDKGQNEIWFVDPGNKRAADLKKLSSEVNGQADVVEGTAELLGNPDRTAAIQVWQQQLRAFEKQSGRHLSQRLSSRAWRSAKAVHTCSTAMPVR